MSAAVKTAVPARCYTRRQLLDLLGITAQTLRLWIKADKIPPPTFAPGYKAYWDVATIDRLLAGRKGVADAT